MSWNLSSLRRLRKTVHRRPFLRASRPALERLESRLAPANVPVLSGHYDAFLSGGNTQETERDEQWVVTIPERLSEAGYVALENFVALAASCMGVEPPEA